LAQEYKKYRVPSHRDWAFDHDLRFWVPAKKCAKYSSPTRKFDENEELTMYGACGDKNIMSEYNTIKGVTLAHESEMEVYNRMRTKEVEAGLNVFVDTDESRMEIASIIQQYFEPLRNDPFANPEKSILEEDKAKKDKEDKEKKKEEEEKKKVKEEEEKKKVKEEKEKKPVEVVKTEDMKKKIEDSKKAVEDAQKASAEALKEANKMVDATRQKAETDLKEETGSKLKEEADKKAS